ncbi:hypothetical protein BCR44DRAFT_1454802, partial [Catenaria anguillulae PL171]
AIAQPLNTLSRADAPLLTKTALMQLPHMDLDLASQLNNVELLRFMLAGAKSPAGDPAGLLLAHFAPEQFENVNAERNMMSVAALQRKAEQGVVKLPSLTDIWCARHPVAGSTTFGRSRQYSSVLACATCIVPFKFEYWPATQAACAAGDFVALKWLHSRQFVFGSRVQVLSCATMAGSIEMLEWIQNHVDVAEPKERLAPPFMFREFDPFLGGFKSERVQVLDWLVDNGYELDSASQFRAVFDWLLARVSSVLEAADLERIAFFDRIGAGILLCQFASSAKPAARFFGQLFEKDNVHVLDWWLNRSGQLMDCLDFGSPYVQASDSLWLDSGRGMHFAACINNASLRGNLKVLDWFLHVAKAPVSEFVKAFTCSSFGPGPFSFETHSRSLLWWWANVPHVCNDPSLRINCYQFSNTIHAHILKDMLKYSFVPLQDVCDSSDHGTMEQLAFQGPQVEQSLVVASQNDHDNVLDWWRTQSGLQDLKCPQELTSGKLKVGVSTKKWWEEKYGVQLVALRDS